MRNGSPVRDGLGSRFCSSTCLLRICHTPLHSGPAKHADRGTGLGARFALARKRMSSGPVLLPLHHGPRVFEGVVDEHDLASCGCKQ
jgi:hypothetical protein